MSSLLWLGRLYLRGRAGTDENVHTCEWERVLVAVFSEVWPCEKLSGAAAGTKRGKETSPERDGKHVKEGSVVDTAVDGIVTVHDPRNGVAEYKVGTLAKMLVALRGFSEEVANAKCWGFGMDPRPGARQRLQSCSCGKPLGAEEHKFPKGFYFEVLRKYKDFC